jgi:hypothetical protein
MNVTTIITPVKEEFTPKFPNPRYTWTDAPNWWNPHGEEIAYIENPLTKQKLYGIKVAEHIPTGWGAVLDYGGRIIPAKDLKFIP